PAAFVPLDSLPLGPNGKVDRRLLAAPDGARPELERPFVAPRGAIEEAVAEIWTDLLRLDRVGAHDDFFHLGGHSLLAMRVAGRIRDRLGVDLPLRTLFEAPT